MIDGSIIEELIASFEKYPEIQFENSKNGMLTIFGQGSTGFDIILHEDLRENTLYLDNFHQHFGKTTEDVNELMNVIFLAITGDARIQELAKKGKPYKWSLQLKDDNGNWIDYETTGLINTSSGKGAELKYLQNKMA